MKILFCGINFSPEVTGVGRYSGETVEYLVSKGHEVHVITGQPYYPQWHVDPAYRSRRVRTENFEGTQVWRVPLWVPRRPTGMTRLIHLLSFACRALPVLASQAKWRPDIVMQVAPTLFCAPAAVLFCGMTGAKSWLHIQDFEVDAAFEMNFLRGRGLRVLTSRIEAKLLQQFDCVSTISGRMLDSAREKGVAKDKLIYFPNWVDTSAIVPWGVGDEFRKELGIGADAVVALYAGNMGDKQGLELLAQVAQLLADIDHLMFVFCGDGAGRTALIKSCEGLKNVRFLPLQPAARLGELLRLADMHLLPQRAGAADLVMPSKLAGMFASGRPVVALADEGTELATVVATRGKVVPAGDCIAFAAAIEELCNAATIRRRLGENGRRFACAEMDKAKILSAFEQTLCQLVDGLGAPDAQPAAPVQRPVSRSTTSARENAPAATE